MTLTDTDAIVRGMACLDVQQRRTVLARWAVAISEIDYDLARWTDDLARWQRRGEPVPSSWLFYQHHAHLPAVHRQTCPQADKATARFVTPELARDHVAIGRWLACPYCNPVGTL